MTKEERRLYQREYYKKNIKKLRAYYREYFKQPKRRAYIVKKNREYKKHLKRQFTLHHEKILARAKLGYNVRKGRIIKPLICSICKEEKKLDGHHHDYSKPLDVIWVCRSCHFVL